MNVDHVTEELTRLREGLKAGIVSPSETTRLEIEILTVVLKVYETELEYRKLRASGGVPPAPFFAEVDRTPMTAEDAQKLQAAIRLRREVRGLFAKGKRARPNHSQ